MGALIKIQQTTNVAEYHSQFIKLSQLVENISEEHLVSCFLAGLQDDLRAEVLLWRPQDMIYAYRIAGVREGINLAKKKSVRSYGYKAAGDSTTGGTLGSTTTSNTTKDSGQSVFKRVTYPIAYYQNDS